MNIPTDRQIFHGEIATYWFEDELLIALSKPAKRTVENTLANADLVRSITGGHKAPLLIYLKPAPLPCRSTRRLICEVLPQIYSSIAMIARPDLTTVVMQLLFSCTPPPLPIKHFTDDWTAKRWLESQAIWQTAALSA